jgi:hypothetical protein
VLDLDQMAVHLGKTCNHCKAHFGTCSSTDDTGNDDPQCTGWQESQTACSFLVCQVRTSETEEVAPASSLSEVQPWAPRWAASCGQGSQAPC